ncbi:cation diffusion facilitator family transporter [Clostridium sp. ZS2-4]|uniref:cation diffusion facilitator family transporter n=1 Tax=Clostridium sp. ZS2-4 TaxID=2987703 RepID=UPI00227A5410|nr:cation diffusion facilitator family transporter [Clostridium sp. ZS2-4]MCY6355918.1 cation diffusion facilitator family transporter [Clostridium sp. ZS2-4]
MNSVERLQIGNKISKLTIMINFLLSVVKIIAGVFGKSNAMISDGIHSLSDVMSTFCVMIGLKLSQKPEDIEHPYGHEKFEPIITKILAFILGITAVVIGYNAVQIIKLGKYNLPGEIAIYAAVLSIVTKEWMYRYTVKGARKIDSSALLADAWHHRSDAFSSIGTLFGIIGARAGYPILDPIASLVICIIILKVAIDIYIKAANQLMDHSADKSTVETIKSDIIEIDGVIKIDELKTRIHANRVYVDVEISVSKELPLTEAHEIAEKVHLKIENNNEKVKHCMVHVNPY